MTSYTNSINTKEYNFANSSVLILLTDVVVWFKRDGFMETIIERKLSSLHVEFDHHSQKYVCSVYVLVDTESK